MVYIISIAINHFLFVNLISINCPKKKQNKKEKKETKNKTQYLFDIFEIKCIMDYP